MRSVDPTDDTADFQALARVNHNSICNAYFDGSSVNFFASGGGCVNTAYASVVAHEMGHWLNVLYGTGNGSDGMGEGNADVFSMYVYDTPVVGEDFFGPGSMVRTGENTTMFCGDCCPGCHGGQVHKEGAVILSLTIGRNGRIEAIEVLRQLPFGLTESAVEAARQWVFEPSTVRGRPVRVQYILTVRFSLS